MDASAEASGLTVPGTSQGFLAAYLNEPRKKNKKPKGTSDLGNPEVAPNWLVELTQKYDVSIIKTEDGKETMFQQGGGNKKE